MTTRNHPDVLPPAGPGTVLARGAEGPLDGRRAGAGATPDHHDGWAGRGCVGGRRGWFSLAGWCGGFGWGDGRRLRQGQRRVGAGERRGLRGRLG